MEKQHTEPSSLNAEKALYKKFFIVMVLSCGMIGGWVFILVLYGSHWLATTQASFSINRIMGDLFVFGVWGWLLGLPAAWLTARSVRKRGLRRNWQGCLKTAAWGAWWNVVTVGELFIIRFLKHIFVWAQTDWYRVSVQLSHAILILAFCGWISAGVLSSFLPKPETDK
ncbi:hypothetical protein [Conchiformibius steedae]|nr:hypothetical protein [Conchiformibius steedae]